MKDTKKANSIFVKHFQQQGHNFNKTRKIHHHRQTGISTHLQRSTSRNVTGKRKFLDSEAKNTSSIGLNQELCK